MKLRLKSKELGRRLRRPVKVLDTERFFERCWKGAPPGIEYLMSRKSPRFFFNPGCAEEYGDILEKRFSGAAAAAINRAARVAGHSFNLLGSGDTFLGTKIDWHRDFKSGQQWPREHYSRIRIVNPHDNSDVKVPWELSRLQFLTDLGRAHWITRDEIYKREFTSLLSDWIKENPVDVGVNWACSMEVAIRAINVIWGLHFFAFEPRELGFLRGIIRALYYHGLHIEKNLEITADGANSNHLVNDYLGLFYLGLMFPEFDRASKWKKAGLMGLENEILAQVFPDGADYECSSSYHRLVLEMFLSAFVLGKINYVAFSDFYRDRLLKMIYFSEAITASSGFAPLVGDNDDGFVVKISTENPADHRPLVDVGLAALGQKGAGRIPVSEERLWYLGPDHIGLSEYAQRPKLRIFRESGYAVIRNDDFHLLFNAAGVPKGNFGGHKHNDLLSFTLEINGVQYLVDPGTYCYSADYKMRNLSRSTAFHNTVVIDDEEQNRFPLQRMFYMADDARPHLESARDDSRQITVSGYHSGYARLGDGIIHRRTIAISPESAKLSITDQFDGQPGREHKFDLHFITPLEAVDKTDGTSVALRKDHIRSLVMQAGEKGLIGLAVTAIEHFPRYGVKAPAKLIAYSYRSTLPFKISCTLIYNDNYADLKTRLKVLRYPSEIEARESGAPR